MKTVAVIPTLNEEKNISDVLSKTRRYADRIIVVDSSSDSTPEIVKSRFKDVILIREESRGKGLALRRGINSTLELMPDYVLLMDGDGERDPSHIPHLIEILERDSVHAVVGIRDMMRSHMRRFLNMFGLWWINLLTGYGLGDAFSGFILFRREALEKLTLKTREFEIETEIILESWKSGFRISEAGITVPKLSGSKFSKMDMLSVNAFFDRWVLKNLGIIHGMKRPFLILHCLAGFILSVLVLFLIRL